MSASRAVIRSGSIASAGCCTSEEYRRTYRASRDEVESRPEPPRAGPICSTHTAQVIPLVGGDMGSCPLTCAKYPDARAWDSTADRRVRMSRAMSDQPPRPVAGQQFAGDLRRL